MSLPSSHQSAGSFDQAKNLAINNQAKLTAVGLVDVSDFPTAGAATAPVTNDLLEALVQEKQEYLQALVQNESIAESAIEIKVLVGKAFVEVIREVLRHERDLIIAAAENAESVTKQLFGGTEKKLLRKCPCPIWLIKSAQQRGYREILVGLDYDPENPDRSQTIPGWVYRLRDISYNNGG